MKRRQFRLFLAAALLVTVAVVARVAWATTTFSGSASVTLSGINTLSGNETGTSAFSYSVTQNLSTGASAPDIVADGGYSGTFTCPTTGGTLNLADSTNICKTGATGTIAPAQGYVITAAKKLRVLYCRDLDPTNTVDVTMPATLGVAGVGWVASQEVAKLQPYGAAMFVFPSGSSTLTAGSNDALVFTSSAGTPQVQIWAAF